MKKVMRIDTNGMFVEDVIIGDNDLTPTDCIDIEVPEGFYHPKWDSTNKIWVEGQTPNLPDVQTAKMSELNQACGQAILGRFTSTVNGVAYQFSNDAEAQSNFKDALWALENNKATTLKWTAYDANGNIVRIDLDLAMLGNINADRLTHQQANVSKLRDTLQPKVYATDATINSIRGITW